MNYSAKQIENAKAKYNAFLVITTVNQHNPIECGYSEAERRCEYHNSIVTSILNGDKELERQWKMFFLKEEVKADAKKANSREKLNANKEASADVLAPIKAIKKIVDFGKWLNNSKNPFRKQHFSKIYTVEAVNAFLATI
ncbi:MAG: hypothetical protein FGM14_15020 [Flavobacteriales bacterium]|nr:hypothetical protein [Flavobacteriales bacterium]